jgi:hypothetical protein
MKSLSLQDEFPRKAELRKLQTQYPVPVLPVGIVDLNSMAGGTATQQARSVVNEFNKFLAADDAAGLASCFLAEQAWWKDLLALTYHLRTFATPDVIVAALLETKKLRGISGGIQLEGAAQFIPASPVLVSSLIFIPTGKSHLKIDSK